MRKTVIPFGPQHPVLPEPIHLMLTVEDERITEAVPNIWQGDANEMVIRSLALAASPAVAFNLTSKDVLSVRTVATRLGELLGKPARLIGAENETALIGNTAKLRALLGDPPTPLEAMIRWAADWVKRGGRSLGKPTHFEVRDGRY